MVLPFPVGPISSPMPKVLSRGAVPLDGVVVVGVRVCRSSHVHRECLHRVRLAALHHLVANGDLNSAGGAVCRVKALGVYLTQRNLDSGI